MKLNKDFKTFCQIQLSLKSKYFRLWHKLVLSPLNCMFILEALIYYSETHRYVIYRDYVPTKGLLAV